MYKSEPVIQPNIRTMAMPVRTTHRTIKVTWEILYAHAPLEPFQLFLTFPTTKSIGTEATMTPNKIGTTQPKTAIATSIMTLPLSLK